MTRSLGGAQFLFSLKHALTPWTQVHQSGERDYVAPDSQLDRGEGVRHGGACPRLLWRSGRAACLCDRSDARDQDDSRSSLLLHLERVRHGPRRTVRPLAPLPPIELIAVDSQGVRETGTELRDVGPRKCGGTTSGAGGGPRRAGAQGARTAGLPGGED
mgnify:CR=1 FL=1